MEHVTTREVILSLSCQDTVGIVHAVSGFLVEHGCNILASQQFDDSSIKRFFMRVQATYPSEVAVGELKAAFQTTADKFGMNWTMSDAADRPRVALLVSKAEHCLNDLLFRWRSGQLKVDFPFIASNHQTLQPVAEAHGIPFFHIPVTPETKEAAEEKLLALIAEHQVDLTVLARYMQVLSDDLCSELAGKAINIHHSFLPGFKGAKPYHQAFDRGVKLVGATAHYVTAELDEGPIIEQEVLRVGHDYSPAQLAVTGQDAERLALARAVQWHAEQRVLLNGNRTVVFN
ncbi:formyltetrahydrofolate deformylase [Arthrobacter sp. StoSoilA2]|uniref:formyltetrahydrofolate deformylase n=1 Tax=unclassified Arthrobacter TaxID=235627 RepID=UPI001CC54970|nr:MULTISPECIES: formyltetrahydrofolate deformylase [unclassified Arthrobacter]BCW38375.1 formyltetrahydrofolate deformylase [Arthrobacter sp. StoSoilA2]BCW50357.1 formyltetrahydrofolate deformylase [Arthrobacter sp. StoSoilB13]